MVTAVYGLNFNKSFYLLGRKERALKNLKEGLYSNYFYLMTIPQILNIPSIALSDLFSALDINCNLWHRSSISSVVMYLGGVMIQNKK